MSKYLFEEITSMENLEDAYKQSQKGKSKYRADAMRFALNETYNLNQLREELISGTYTFGAYIRFKVYEPKERIIHAPQYRDKIVQLAINNVIKRIYQQCFIYDSYACIDKKGTHRAVDRVSLFMRKAGWEYGEGAHIIKLDIRKFFYSIDRENLKGILPKKIRCKRTLELLYKIIDSAEVIDLLGLPLGNTLSQLFANVLMNLYDNFCKRKMSLRYYVRYADDAITIVSSREEAVRVLDLMVEFLNKRVKLDVNEYKTKIFPIEQGVNAYGYKIYRTHRLLRNDSKKKIKRKAKKMRRLIFEGGMSVETAEQILNSWRGHAMHGNSFNFINSLVVRNPYIYVGNKGVLKIDMKEVTNYDTVS